MWCRVKAAIVNISKNNNGMMEAPVGDSNVLAKTTIDLTKKSKMQENGIYRDLSFKEKLGILLPSLMERVWLSCAPRNGRNVKYFHLQKIAI